MSAAPRWSLALLAGLLLVAAAHRANYHQRYAADPVASAPYGDSLVYLDEVKRQFVDPRPSAFYKHPLYTVLLHGLDGESPSGRARVRDVQWLLGLLTLAMAYSMARRRAGPVAGGLAFVLLALYAPLLFEESKLLDTSLGVFTLTAAVFAFDSWDPRRRAAAGLLVGVAFGVAALARSPALLVVLLLAGWLAWRGSWRAAAAMLVGAAMTVAPVTWHNVRAEGDLVVTNASDAFTFLAGNNAAAVGIYSLPPDYPDGVLLEREVERDMARAALGREPTLGEQRRYTYGRALRWIRDDPAGAARLLWHKLRFAVSSYEVDDNYSLARERDRFGLLAGMVVPFSALLVLGVMGLVLMRERRAALIAGLLVTLLVLLIFYVTSRFRLVAAPLLAVASGVGVVGLASPSTSSRRRWTAVAAGAGLALFLGLTDLPVPRAALDASEAYFSTVLDLHAARAVVQRGDVGAAATILAAGIDAAERGAIDGAGRSAMVPLQSDLYQLLLALPPRQLDDVTAQARAAAPESAAVAEVIERASAGR